MKKAIGRRLVCLFIFSGVVLSGIVLMNIWAKTSQKTPIVFVSKRDGNAEIYVMDENGRNQHRLLSTPHGGEEEPSWSPNCHKIVFLSDLHLVSQDLYVMDVDRKSLRRVTKYPDAEFSPSWSPDGSKIAFESKLDGDREIYVINADGKNLRKLTNNSSSDVDPSWSPDGSKIAFSSSEDVVRSEIFVMDANGRNKVNLTRNDKGADCAPSWSPDGSKIAFASNRDGKYEIYVMDSDGRNQRNLTRHPDTDYEPSWSPDGSKIIFTSLRDGQREIYVMDADGRNQRNLTNNPAWDYSPDWCNPNLSVNLMEKRGISWGWLKKYLK